MMQKYQRFIAHLGAAVLILVLAGGIGGCGNAADSASTDSGSKIKPVSAEARTDSGKEGSFVITGHLPELKDGTKVSIETFRGAAEGTPPVVATTVARNGQFSLTGSVDAPFVGNLAFGPLDEKHETHFMIVENANYTVVNTNAGLAIEGGHYNDIVYGYMKMPAYIAAAGALEKGMPSTEGINMTDEAAVKSLREKYAALERPVTKIVHDYHAKILDGNYSALEKVLVLASGEYDNDRYPWDVRATMLADYARTLGDGNPVIASLRKSHARSVELAAVQQSVSAGHSYRDIEAVDGQGHAVRLSDVLAKHKLVLLDFWASWCSPCREQFPFLAKVYRKYRDQGFDIYSVSLDTDDAAWSQAMKEEHAKGNFPWSNLRAAEGFKSAAAKAYGLVGIPYNVLISSDGTIIGVGMREWDIDRAIRKQLGASDASKG